MPTAALARLRLNLEITIPPEKLEGSFVFVEEWIFIGALHRRRLPPRITDAPL